MIENVQVVTPQAEVIKQHSTAVNMNSKSVHS